MLQSRSASVETKASWAVASVALFILGMSFGAAWITAVALKDIASEVGGSRSVPALASSLAWLGSGVGGLIMSPIARRIGGINAPLYVYVSRWFDRRRGSALALISSGTYLAGTIWPPIFQGAIIEF